ncbi:MAG TPA: phospholipase D-like domain-containing protein [Geobacteraceae bacterium]|nr:phospholipase D-like domain-containing protein [Geobacteraceae bacterium]
MASLRVTILVLAAVLLLSPLNPLSAGEAYQTRTRLLPNREYGEAFLQGIKDARKSILCTFYLFKTTGSAGNPPERIAEELVRARRRGVEVTVILERDNGRKGDSLTAENRHTAAFLSRGGVRVFFDSPAVVTHVKAAVIDGRYVFLGSHNLSQGALRHNNELSVLIDSPELAADVTGYMERL